MIDGGLMQESNRYAIVDYMGSWNIGAFIITTNEYAIIGEGFRPQIQDQISGALNVGVHVQRIYGEDLVGCLLVANTHGIVVPYEAYEHEVKAIKNKLGVNVLRARFREVYSNALGNIILISKDKGIIHNDIYAKNKKMIEQIEDVLDVEIVPFGSKVTEALASYIIANSRGIVFSPLFSEEEIEEMRNILGFSRDRTIVGTINMGNPIVRSGCAANDYGVVVGNRTTGIELARIFNTLIG